MYFNEHFTAFLPSMMCVFLSWASFWIKLSIAPARVALGITTYLSIKTMGKGISHIN